MINTDYIEEEQRRLLKQANCPHGDEVYFKKGNLWSLRCTLCGKVLDCDTFHSDEEHIVINILL